MKLTKSQVLRLDLEKEIVRKQFHDDFDLHLYAHPEPCFVGWVTTTCQRTDYQLTLNLGRSYPDRRPELYVTCPTRLKKYRGVGYINDLGTSHAFHTWDNGPNHCVQICHSEYWNAGHTCVDVLLRGVLWLEFYEAYLRNGGDIDQYCH